MVMILLLIHPEVKSINHDVACCLLRYGIVWCWIVLYVLYCMICTQASRLCVAGRVAGYSGRETSFGDPMQVRGLNWSDVNKWLTYRLCTVGWCLPFCVYVCMLNGSETLCWWWLWLGWWWRRWRWWWPWWRGWQRRRWWWIDRYRCDKVPTKTIRR